MLIEGRRLFLEQGYTAASVDAICEAAGVTKGAFFHHFESKDDFASQVLSFTWRPVSDAHDGDRPETDAMSRLGWHIEFMARWICDTGRLLPSLAQELGSSNPEIRDQVGGYFATWMGYLDTLLAAAVEETTADVDIEALKEFIVATTEGVPIVRSQFGDQALVNVSEFLVRSVMAALSAPA